MQKTAALITSEWIQFSGRTSSSRHQEANKTGEVMAKWVCSVH